MHGVGLDVAGVGQVRPVAQVHHGAAAVQGDDGIIWQALDDLDLRDPTGQRLSEQTPSEFGL